MQRLSQIKVIVFVVVLLFTFFLRSHSYEKAPTANHLDEQLYALSGINLIETGYPISWSTLPYPDSTRVYQGEINFQGHSPKASVTLYKPWLDEPPLFSLIVGWFAHIYHADRNGFIPSTYIRIPMVIISTIASILIFLLTKKIGGYWRAIFAMLLYGTIPVMVFASRTAMPETLISLLMLLLVYLLYLFWQKPKFWLVAPMPLIVGVAGLAKPTGYLLLPLALYYVIARFYQDKKIKIAFKYCLYLILLTLPFVAAYFLYGMHYDWQLFKIIYSVQALRPVGFGSLAWYFITPAVDTVVIRDSWFIFSLLAAFYFMLNAKSEFKKFIVFPLIYSIIIVMLMGGENDLLAWYRFPSYPYLAIIAVYALEYLYKKANFYTSFIAIGLLIGNRMLLVNAFHPNVLPMEYRLIFIGLMLPSVLNTILHKKILQKLSKYVIIAVIATGLTFNSLYIYLAYEVECQNKTCPTVPSTTLSKLGFPLIGKMYIKYGK